MILQEPLLPGNRIDSNAVRNSRLTSYKDLSFILRIHISNIPSCDLKVHFSKSFIHKLAGSNLNHSIHSSGN